MLSHKLFLRCLYFVERRNVSCSETHIKKIGMHGALVPKRGGCVDTDLCSFFGRRIHSLKDTRVVLHLVPDKSHHLDRICFVIAYTVFLVSGVLLVFISGVDDRPERTYCCCAYAHYNSAGVKSVSE